MVFKITNAHDLGPGNTVLIEGEACTIRSNDISKSGKHGASKCRIEAIGILSGKKRVMATPGDTRFEVPTIDKRKAQVLSVAGDKANVMDLESFENFELLIDEELKNEIKDGLTVEYWDIEGAKMIKKVMS